MAKRKTQKVNSDRLTRETTLIAISFSVINAFVILFVQEAFSYLKAAGGYTALFTTIFAGLILIYMFYITRINLQKVGIHLYPFS